MFTGDLTMTGDSPPVAAYRNGPDESPDPIRQSPGWTADFATTPTLVFCLQLIARESVVSYRIHAHQHTTNSISYHATIRGALHLND
jgi:hypothetical protein